MNFNTLYDLINEGTAPRSYSCLMLDCGFLFEDIRDHIHSAICPCDVYDDEPGHGIEEEVHTTVLYGIHTEKFSEVTESVELKPCSFKIQNISLFKNDKYDVLKFGLTSKDLSYLNKQCCEGLDYTNSYPDYKPHITLAYLKPGMGKVYSKLKCDLIGTSWTSDIFIFSDKNSNKVHYRA